MSVHPIFAHMFADMGRIGLLPFMALLHGGVLVGTLGALAVRHNRWSPRMLWVRPGIREAA